MRGNVIIELIYDRCGQRRFYAYCIQIQNAKISNDHDDRHMKYADL
jgi:hypothetical protein